MNEPMSRTELKGIVNDVKVSTLSKGVLRHLRKQLADERRVARENGIKLDKAHFAKRENRIFLFSYFKSINQTMGEYREQESKIYEVIILNTIEIVNEMGYEIK